MHGKPQEKELNFKWNLMLPTNQLNNDIELLTIFRYRWCYGKFLGSYVANGCDLSLPLLRCTNNVTLQVVGDW